MTASLERSDIDWRAVKWVAQERIRLPLNRAEHREVVRLLMPQLDTGRLSVNELAELLGVTDRTVERDKAKIRAERRELAAS